MGVFLVPSKILSGVGAINELGANIKGKGNKALIVTDKFMVQFGNVAKVTNALDACNIEYVVYDGISGEPTDKMVAEGVKLYQENECDFLIGLGGGSPMDSAKAIGVMVASDAKKILLAGPSVLPALAVVDPAFTMTAPPSVTAATGVDALCHAVEAYTSRKAQPLSDTFALSAIKKIHKNLPICFADGKNEQARMQMALGATEAGIAFNNSSVTIVHGMSRPIGALFHIAHGVSNAVLLPACMEFAIQENTARFAEIARIMEVATDETDDMTAAKAFVAEVTRFCKELNIPSVEEILNKNGFTKDDFLAQLDSGSPANTMRQPIKEEIIEIYKKLF